MRSSLSRFAKTIVVTLVLVACAPGPSPSPATVASSPSSSAMPPTPQASAPATPPPPATATLPVGRSAKEIGLDIGMAPGPNGTLYVSVPRPGGSVLALLDRSGRPATGWPIAVPKTTSCGVLLPVDDGSVRVVCDAKDAHVDELGNADYMRAFAFDSGGRTMAGWPVQVKSALRYVGRAVGNELVLVGGRGLGDVSQVGAITEEVWMTRVAAGGEVRSGTSVPIVETLWGWWWAVGPDSVAYGAASIGDNTYGGPKTSSITALDADGIRPGWPVTVDGVASRPAFGPDGRIVVTVGSFFESTSHIFTFDSGGKVASTSPEDLTFDTAHWSEDCLTLPISPIVAEGGTIFVLSDIDPRIYALNPSLGVVDGWPFEAPARLIHPNPWDSVYGQEGINCPLPSLPAIGPDSTLYLLLRARDESVGGSIVAVGPDGRVRPGWPVQLRRRGAEFWSVVVGSDGTAYALAIEPETGGRSSATVLAIAPDSTVLNRTTIVEP